LSGLKAGAAGSRWRLPSVNAKRTRNAPIMIHRNVGLGTPEHAWRGWPGVDALPVIAPEILVPKGYRAVVVAPHPDDESIGVGGLISRLAMLKRSIMLVAATDGAASRPGSRMPGRAVEARTLETWHAAQRLGAGRTTILRAGLDHGEVAHIERDLEWRLRGLLLPSDVVFATWRHDGHPDHEAIGRVTAHACATLLIHMVEVPIWAWQWSFPGDRRIPWKRARRIFLNAALKARSRLARFARPYEIVFV
jgi:GlcNAc-PI de-N-acetylase